MKYQFSFLKKQCAENILPILFEILYSNMSVIAPTGNTYEQDFQLWQSSVAPALSKQQRQIVLMYSDDEIVGYFQYYVNDSVFMMEEIQIISNQIILCSSIFPIRINDSEITELIQISPCC